MVVKVAIATGMQARPVAVDNKVVVPTANIASEPKATCTILLLPLVLFVLSTLISA